MFAFLGMFKNNLTLILFCLIGLMVLGFTGYFYWAQSKIDNQTKQLLTYEISLKNQESIISKLNRDIGKIKEINTNLTKIERDSTQNASLLADNLLEIEKLSKTNLPEAEAKIINLSKDRIRCFEFATGSLPIKNEKNTVCPHLLK